MPKPRVVAPRVAATRAAKPTTADLDEVQGSDTAILDDAVAGDVTEIDPNTPYVAPEPTTFPAPAEIDDDSDMTPVQRSIRQEHKNQTEQTHHTTTHHWTAEERRKHEAAKGLDGGAVQGINTPMEAPATEGLDDEGDPA